jgi:hypothetical protein
LVTLFVAGSFPSSPILCRAGSFVDWSSASAGVMAVPSRSAENAVAIMSFIVSNSLVTEIPSPQVSLTHLLILANIHDDLQGGYKAKRDSKFLSIVGHTQETRDQYARSLGRRGVIAPTD